MESGRRRRMYSSWLPIDSARIRLLMRIRAVKNTKSYHADYKTSKYQHRMSHVSIISMAVTEFDYSSQRLYVHIPDTLPNTT